MNSKEIIAYKCKECGRTYIDREIAEDCCKPNKCDVCGEITPRYQRICEQCLLKKRFEKAEKLTDWDGWVFCEGLGYNEGYFSSVQELIEYCEVEDEQIPKWVFVCESELHTLDVDSILENMLDDAYDDAQKDLVDVDELKYFIDKWNKKQHIESYCPDYSKVLIL